MSQSETPTPPGEPLPKEPPNEPPPPEKRELEVERENAQKLMWDLEIDLERSLGLFLRTLLPLGLIAVIAANWIFTNWVGYPPVGPLKEAIRRIGFYKFALLLWGSASGFSGFMFLWDPSRQRRVIQQRLRKIEDDLDKLYATSPVERRAHLREVLAQRTNEIARVLRDNKARYAHAKKLRDDAEEHLSSREPSLSEVQSLLTSINELVLREESELREQRNWRRIATLIMLAYVVFLISAPMLLASDVIIPVFRIPSSVVMWGALGSLAAILYRFYTERERVRFDLEVRWLIARPLVGIIMGCLAYLALVTGLLLLVPEADRRATESTPAQSAPAGSTAPAERLPSGGVPSPSPGTADTDLARRMPIYWIVAFLAGFSDKFYTRIIKLLVEKTVGDGESEERPPKAKRSKHDSTVRRESLH